MYCSNSSLGTWRNLGYKSLAKPLNLIGQKYGKLKVLERATNNKKRSYWLCQCECGNTKVISGSHLRRKKEPTRSCGCLLIKHDLVGKIFNFLKVVKRVKNPKRPTIVCWLCVCECGEERIVDSYSLISGQRKSCGCKTKELCSNAHSKNLNPGDRFYNLVIVKKASSFGEPSKWLCRCDCENEKVVRRCHLVSGNTKDCGCKARAETSNRFKKDMIGENYGRLKVLRDSGKKSSGRILWTCSCECGNITFATRQSLKSSSKRSCGCLFLEIVNSYKGKNHPQWNESLTEEERGKRRNLPGLSLWREFIFEKDDFTCKSCLSRGGKLNTHHLDGWHWCEEKRLDKENGITLCEKCHRAFHKIYGTKNNTRIQFHEYMRRETNV